jgi:hypothetical protein
LESKALTNLPNPVSLEIAVDYGWNVQDHVWTGPGLSPPNYLSSQMFRSSTCVCAVKVELLVQEPSFIIV